MSVQGYWADLKAPDFADLPGGTVAILPIGAVEQHGPHLPLSVDCDLPEAVLARLWTHLGGEVSALVLPTLSITKSDEHSRFPGTLTLSAETLLAVLREIGASVARAGVERLVLFNGHGGNTALLQVAARELRRREGMIVVTCSWSGFSDTEGVIAPAAYAMDLHAGEGETSAMLAARPERVEMTAARDFRPAMRDWAEPFPSIGLTGQPAAPGWLIGDLNPEGAVGNAAAASAEKGEALLDSAARNFAAFLAEFARFDHREGTR
ncbi:MAG: creatininase family protein [Roseovarius sp.]